MTTTSTGSTELLHHARQIAQAATSLSRDASLADVFAAVLDGFQGVALVSGACDADTLETLSVACNDRNWQVFAASGSVDAAANTSEALRGAVVVHGWRLPSNHSGQALCGARCGQ